MPDESSSNAARYALLATALTVASLGGYLGYVLYPRFDLPATAGAGLLLLAATAGFAAFFSPCSFPLLATLLARQAGDDLGGGRRLYHAAAFAACGRAHRLARQIEAGVVSVNSNTSVHTGAPFGGWKQSGYGRELGVEALRAYTELKNVYVDISP